MFGELTIISFIWFIQREIDKIETRKEWRRDIDILNDRELGVKLGLYGIRRRKDRCTSVQSGNDTGLGDRDGLLFLLSSSIEFCLTPIAKKENKR